MRIAIDIDGVLAKFTPDGIRPVVDGIWPGQDRLPEGYAPKDWDHSDVFSKEDWDRIWAQIARTKDFWESLPAYIRNSLALQGFLISNPDIDVYYVTSRVSSSGSSILGQTNRWLKIRGLLRSNTSVIVAPSRVPKGQIYEALGVRYSIDDWDRNVREAISTPKHIPFLLNRPWNEGAQGLSAFRVATLQEYLNYVLHHFNIERGKIHVA